MRTFLMTLALVAGIVGWSASAVRAADEKPATTPSTKPAEKTEGSSGAADASSAANKSADKSADDAKQAGSSEKPAAETPAK
jgi:hypothetical protein